MFLGRLEGLAAATGELSRRTALADAYGWAAARDASRLVADAMTKRAMSGPPGPNVDTGRLSNSIIVEGPHRVGFGHYQARIGPSGVEYARVIEIGDRARNHRKHPYARPGLKDSKAEAGAVWRRAMARATAGT